MNRWVGMGRLTKEPDVRISTGENRMTITRYTVAIDRRGKDQPADFIPCVSFGKTAEFAEKWFHQGMRICVEGRIQTGSYKDKEGRTVYTTEVVVDNHEFAQNKSENVEVKKTTSEPAAEDFLAVPDDVGDEGLPWNG